jgi:hypothetical protein
MVVALAVAGPGVEDRQFTEHVGRAQDGAQRLLAVRRLDADLDLAGDDDVQPVAGLTLGEHCVTAREVGGLQMAGQRGRRVGCDSLDSSPAEDFVHGWPHQLLSRMTRLSGRVLTEQTYSRVTTYRRALDRGRRRARATVVDRTEREKTLLGGLPTEGVKHRAFR